MTAADATTGVTGPDSDGLSNFTFALSMVQEGPVLTSAAKAVLGVAGSASASCPL